MLSTGTQKPQLDASQSTRSGGDQNQVRVHDQRAGIEGTHAQGVRRMGLRRSRYIGEPRTHLQHVATAAAINLCRLDDWLTGVSPHPTPLSQFERFMKEAA